MTEQLRCDHCKSPINLVKARRRYIKKCGSAPNGIALGICACGTSVYKKFVIEEGVWDPKG